MENTSDQNFFCIDESAYTRTIIKRILKDEKYDFLGEAVEKGEAISKLKALKFKKNNVQLIFMEYFLADTKGSALIPVLREIHPGIKIIILTRDASRKTVSSCIKAGANGFILKPLTKEKFHEAINIITINELIAKKTNLPNQPMSE